MTRPLASFPAHVHIRFVLLLSVAGCAPVVTHGPRVEPGRSSGVVGGWRAGLCDSGCTAGLVPPIGLFGSYGFAPQGGRGAAYSVGVFVPGLILFPAAHLDLYAQAPSPPERPLVYGGGVSASVGHVMPYVQAGSLSRGRRGWYTTQGVVLANYRPEPKVIFNGGRGSVFEEVASVYWSPAVAYRGPRGTVFVSGAFGREAFGPYEANRDQSRVPGHRPVRMLLMGVSIDDRLTR